MLVHRANGVSLNEGTNGTKLKVTAGSHRVVNLSTSSAVFGYGTQERGLRTTERAGHVSFRLIPTVPEHVYNIIQLYIFDYVISQEQLVIRNTLACSTNQVPGNKASS